MFVKRIAIPQRRVHGLVDVCEEQGEGEEEGEEAKEDAHPQLEGPADLLATVHQAASSLLQISLLSFQQSDLLLEPINLTLLKPGHLPISCSLLDLPHTGLQLVHPPLHPGQLVA